MLNCEKNDESLPVERRGLRRNRDLTVLLSPVFKWSSSSI